MVKIMENPLKMDDLGVLLFLETPIYSFGRSEKKNQTPVYPFSFPNFAEKNKHTISRNVCLAERGGFLAI